MSWTLIEHQALTSSVASVTLGSGGTIPQTYKTLKLVISSRTDRSDTSDNVKVSFNGSNSSFTLRQLQGSGSTVGSNSYTTNNIQSTDGNTATSNTFGSMEITIPNYAGSTNKPFSVDAVDENNATVAFQTLTAGLWSNTAAITSIGVTMQIGPNFLSGSTFTLYGLA